MFRNTFKFNYLAFAAVLVCACGSAAVSHAQDTAVQVTTTNEAEASESQPSVDILPAAQAQERGITYDNDMITHPALKLTPDKSHLLRLDKPAGSIIIGNPSHLNILADSSQTLVVIPRQPGATFFTVLDKDGRVQMQRHVIVASPKEKYLRVRRSCAGSEGSCAETSVFYCPDMCHEVIMGEGEQNSGMAGIPASAASMMDGPPVPGQAAIDAAGGEDPNLVP